MINNHRPLRPEIKEEEEQPVLIENGEFKDVGDDVEEDYAEKHQKELREAILAQELPLAENFEFVVKRIKESFTRSGAFILQGETGSGKSIFTPLAVMAALQDLGLIEKTVVMQPRRDAARGVARAVAAVADKRLGEGVGFSTSENKEQNWYTPIKVVTPGIFIKYLSKGSLTREQVGCLIIDEAHESTVDRDLVLGLIKLMSDRADSPKILLTSATLDKEKLQNYFGLDDQYYMNIEGRTYPVEKHFLTEKEKYTESVSFDGQPYRREKNYLDLAAEKVREINETKPPGDILVFLPGSFEINNLIDSLDDLKDIEVLPLHGGLKPEERDAALLGYKPGGKRRIIVSTNIAETSVTVPGIKYVVDSGRQRMVRFNTDKGAQEKGTELISQDQAKQRAGRAGRIESGEYFSLLTEKEYGQLEKHPLSEIKKVNFSHTYLRIKSFGLNVEDFPFIDPPSQEMIEHAEKELKILGALDQENNLTQLGEQMMELSTYFEPRIARMVIEAKKYHCVPQALLMAAFEREKNIFLPPAKDDDEKYGSRKMANIHYQHIRKQHFDSNSDFIRSLQVFSEALQHNLLDSKHWDKSPEGIVKYEEYNDWCDESRINPKSLKHIAYNIRRYLIYVDQADFNLNELISNINEEDLSKVIYSAYPDRLMYLTTSKGDYQSATEISSDEHKISPGSAAFGLNNPKICLAKAEKGRDRSYLQNVHPISLKTIAQISPDIVEISNIGDILFEENDGHYSAYQYQKIALKNQRFVSEEIKVELPGYSQDKIKEILDQKKASAKEWEDKYWHDREERILSENQYKARQELLRKQQDMDILKSKYKEIKERLEYLEPDERHFFLALFPGFMRIETDIATGDYFNTSAGLNSMARFLEKYGQIYRENKEKIKELMALYMTVNEYVNFLSETPIIYREIRQQLELAAGSIKNLAYYDDKAEQIKLIRRQLNSVKHMFRDLLEKSIQQNQSHVLSGWENKALNYLSEFKREDERVQAELEAKKAEELAERKKSELTPEQKAEKMRQKLLDEISWAEFLYADILTNKMIKDPYTRQEKEINRLLERAKPMIKSIREAKGASKDPKNDLRLSGIAVNLVSTLENISTQISRLKGLNQNWPEKYKLIQKIIPEIESELGELSSEDMKRLQPKLIILAKDLSLPSREELKDRLLELITE